MRLKKGAHALDTRFHAFEKGVHFFGKEGVPIYKNNIIFISLGVHAFEKGVHFLGKGFTFMKNTK